jgi:hypothetical protein
LRNGDDLMGIAIEALTGITGLVQTHDDSAIFHKRNQSPHLRQRFAGFGRKPTNGPLTP